MRNTEKNIFALFVVTPLAVIMTTWVAVNDAVVEGHHSTFVPSNYSIGIVKWKTTLRPMLNTPCLPVITFKSAYLRRLKWSW